AKYVPTIQKRDGRKVPFSFEKVVRAVYKAMEATGEGSKEEAEIVAHRVASELMGAAKKFKAFVPPVEAIQDEVERQLMTADYTASAKAFILYREEHARQRQQEALVSDEVKSAVVASSKYFSSSYQE